MGLLLLTSLALHLYASRVTFLQFLEAPKSVLIPCAFSPTGNSPHSLHPCFLITSRHQFKDHFLGNASPAPTPRFFIPTCASESYCFLSSLSVCNHKLLSVIILLTEPQDSMSPKCKDPPWCHSQYNSSLSVWCLTQTYCSISVREWVGDASVRLPRFGDLRVCSPSHCRRLGPAPRYLLPSPLGQILDSTEVF